MKAEFQPVVRKVDLVIAEAKELAEEGPHVRIIHCLWKPGTICAAGEEIAAVLLVHRSREYPLKLSLALRLLFDYMARHSRFPLSASQIAVGMRASQFHMKHARNACGRMPLHRGICRTAIKTYMQRLCAAFEIAFREANIDMNPAAVVRCRSTVTNEVGYQLRLTAHWIHWADRTARSQFPRDCA